MRCLCPEFPQVRAAHSHGTVCAAPAHFFYSAVNAFEFKRRLLEITRRKVRCDYQRFAAPCSGVDYLKHEVEVSCAVLACPEIIEYQQVNTLYLPE